MLSAHDIDGITPDTPACWPEICEFIEAAVENGYDMFAGPAWLVANDMKDCTGIDHHIAEISHCISQWRQINEHRKGAMLGQTHPLYERPSTTVDRP